MLNVTEFHRRECLSRRFAHVMRGRHQPEGTADRVPLKQVIEELGSALFPEEWTGHEQDHVTVPELPDPINFGAGLLGVSIDNDGELARWATRPGDEAFEYASRLLAHLAPEHAPPSALARISFGWPQLDQQYTLKQWRMAQHLAKQRKALISDDWKRLTVVHRTFKTLCVEKRLRTYLRPAVGGDFSKPLDWWVWNSEYIWDRLFSYRMNPADMFSQRPTPAPSHWIFSDRPDLDREVRSLRAPTTSAAGGFDGLYLSPFMRCAIDAIGGMSITGENMPKKDEIIAELPTYWKGEGPLTEKMKEAVAKVIRDEDSRAGRGSRHDRARASRRKGGG